MRSDIRFLATMIFTMAGAMALGADPIVSNVRAAQRAGTKLVDVYYDLSGTSGLATVQVAASADGGVNFNVPATSLSGAVGNGVGMGLNKHVVWNAGADWDGQYSQAVRFRITASAPAAPDELEFIPAGWFTMGRTSGDTYYDQPPVSVYVSAFYMAKYEVTKDLWDEVRTWGLVNGYTDLASGAGKAGNHPVHSINWYDIVKWCNARSQKDGLTPCYTVSGVTYKTGAGTSDTVACNWAAGGYRLPTEAEWEKAARGGQSGLRFPWGDTISHSQANYWSLGGGAGSYDLGPTSGYHPSYNDGIQPYTSPVGSFAANGYGLHDMTGNIRERCWDWYSDVYYRNGAINPRGPPPPGPASSAADERIVRGGGWVAIPSDCRSASRDLSKPSTVDRGLGFRPARISTP
ncbi:SUMF1/EgtB/PvdO family nonheme iron enzyme [Prosthecobacter sp.]|uniref:formylglycine-generating enzyme family protein n=1 Tax=Prosthecobacter sp. TaxID=1965333 RepID=UPI001D273220|nr:SUMF1/EgtB/PvdO family nonheme iron enzyme [Prosthecobacter sp.]MCB1278092.1 SUMF1/EgtB/PvdO family nonheme iron enzyme [Prosthecobacter sp.]